MNLERLIPYFAQPHQVNLMRVVDHVVALNDELSHITDTTLRWCAGPRFVEMANKRPGGVLLIPEGLTGIVGSYTVECKLDPRRAFAQAMYYLYPHPVRPQVTVGTGCSIHATAVIGKDGFGFIEGRRMRHIGGVHIMNGCSIGAHTCIDRGTIGDTIIGPCTQVDNLVHIAHNVKIGARCHIVAGAVIGGSVTIGDDVFVGINASIRNGITIGDGAIIGMGAVVTKDVPPGVTVAGNPARIIQRTPN